MGLEHERAGLFPLGRIEITLEADALLTPADIRQAILGHRNGDWGDVDDETRSESQSGIGYARLAICSHYWTTNGTLFWLMTELRGAALLFSWDKSPSRLLIRESPSCLSPHISNKGVFSRFRPSIF